MYISNICLAKFVIQSSTTIDRFILNTNIFLAIA